MMVKSSEVITILMFSLFCMGMVNAYPTITSWSNNITYDNSSNIVINKGEMVNFNVGANETITTWNWTLNGAEQNNSYSNWTYAFSSTGTYYINVSGSNENGTTQTIEWRIYVIDLSPMIISWYNNKTGDNSTVIEIDAGETVSFNVTTNRTVQDWNWTLNGVEQNNNYSYWAYAFPYGVYNVSVLGSNENGTTQTMNWTVSSILKITDAFGNNVTISEEPERIVSLAPSNTEILFALGLGNKLVGVTNYCDYPPEAVNITKIGGFYNPNVELIVNSTPDLIFASDGNDNTVINQLIALNYTLIGLRSSSIQEILDNILLVGRIGKVENVSSSVVTNMEQRMDAVVNSTNNLTESERLRTFYVFWYPELWTAGNGTFPHDLIQKAGGKNIANNISGYGVMNSEVLVTQNPQVIICSGMGGSAEDICNQIKDDTVLKNIDALQNNNMYTIDSNIVERPGPRIVDGLEGIYGILRNVVIPPQPSPTPSPSSSSSGGGGGGGSEQISGVKKIEVTPENIGSFIKRYYLIAKQFYSTNVELAGVIGALDYMPTTPDLIELVEGATLHKVRKLEGDPYKIASEKVLARYPGGRSKVIIARGDLGVDALASVAYAQALGIPILLVKPNEIPMVTLNALTKLGTSSVIIVGGPEAVYENVEEELPDTGRIWGQDRFETAVKIAEALVTQKYEEGKSVKTMVITDGRNPDLNAVILATFYKAPILYTDGDKVPESTRNFLNKEEYSIIMIGVSPVAEREIRDLYQTQ